MLTRDQLHERAVNMIEAKVFFAQKDLEQNQLEIDGVISSKINEDLLMDVRYSKENKLDTLHYIQEALELYHFKRFSK